MRVIDEKTGKGQTVRYTGSVRGLLERLRVNPETVLVVRDGMLLTKDAVLREKDTVTVLSVVSGG